MNCSMCRCDVKRKFIGGLVIAVAYWLMDMFFHHFCLGSLYQSTMSFWRPMEEAMPLMGWAYVGYLVFALFFYCIYGFGVESGKPAWQQGLRYGIFIAILVHGAGGLMTYPHVPYPGKLWFDWFLIGLFEYAVLGVLTGLLFKKKA